MTRLSDKQWEELSAYLDGELDEQRAAEVRSQLAGDPAWAEAIDAMRAVDTALDAWPAPTADEQFAQRISEHVQSRRTTARRFWRIASGMAVASAAAAAILLAVVLLPDNQTKRGSGPMAITETNSASQQDAPTDFASTELAESDRTVVENLDFFRNYNVLENYETLKAIERLEKQNGEGT